MISKWKVFVARVTIFPSGPPLSPSPDAQVLYRHMWGADPDGFQKASNPLSPSISQGKKDGLAINCIVTPARIDFNVMASPIQPLELALIEEGGKVRSEMERMVTAIRQCAVPILASRVALYIQAMIPTTGTVEANKLIAATSPLKVSNEEEVVFQVNKRYRSSLLPVDMNALIRWSAETLQIVALPMPMGAPEISGVSSEALRREIVAAIVSFDVNNRPTQNLLDAEKQSALLREALEFVSGKQREILLNIEGL